MPAFEFQIRSEITQHSKLKIFTTLIIYLPNLYHPNYLKPNIFLLIILIILIAIFLWPAGARIVRTQALTLKESTHVYAARSFGVGWKYLLRCHIAPEMGPVLAAIIIQLVRRAVFMEAGLSLLGIFDPSLISWGKMMQSVLEFTYLDYSRFGSGQKGQ